MKTQINTVPTTPSVPTNVAAPATPSVRTTPVVPPTAVIPLDSVPMTGATPARRLRRMHLGACPRCGGDVRLGRDIYGAYYRCLQCSREISPAMLTARLSAAAAPAPMAPHTTTAPAARTPLIA